MRLTVHGQRRRIDLGEYPGTSLSLARELAQDARRLAGQGKDPEHAVRPPVAAKAVTVNDAMADWLATKAANRSQGLEKRRVELHVLPVIGEVAVRDVTRAQLHALVHDLAYRKLDPIPVEANRVYTTLRGFFRWAVEAGHRDDDPSAQFRKPVKVEPSERRRKEGTEPLLDMSELARLWSVAASLPGGVLPDLVRCLLLVPLRREEWTGLEWGEFQTALAVDGWKGPALRLPAERMKGRRPAFVPLPAKAVEIVEGRRRLTERSGFVFSVPGRDSPFAGWRRGAGTLRDALDAVLPAGHRRGPWSVHTIRGSVATAMVRELGADELLVGRLLQHSPRSALGVTSVYQRSHRLAEQAKLVEDWSARLQTIAAGLSADSASTVVPLRPIAAVAL